jgi:hypothetical protein
LTLGHHTGAGFIHGLFYAKIGSAREMSELACDDCRMFNVVSRLSSFVRNLRTIVIDGLSFFAGVWRHHTALAAENLFLRKQLALFREREKKAMPTTPATGLYSPSWLTGSTGVVH